MPTQIISALGSQNGMIVNSDGSLNVAISGGIVIGSVSASVDSIYVQSGVTFVDSRTPTSNSYNPTLTLNYSGTTLSQVIKTVPTGSSVLNLNWSGGLLVGVGSWV